MAPSKKRKVESPELQTLHNALKEMVDKELLTSETFINSKLRSEPADTRAKISRTIEMVAAMKQEKVPKLARSLDSVRSKLQTIKEHDKVLAKGLRKVAGHDRKDRYNKTIEIQSEALRKQLQRLEQSSNESVAT